VTVVNTLYAILANLAELAVFVIAAFAVLAAASVVI
jgi:hypothetical protein